MEEPSPKLPKNISEEGKSAEPVVPPVAPPSSNSPAPSSPESKKKKFSEAMETIGELLYDWPYTRPVWKVLVKEEKALKEGWPSMLIAIVICCFITHSCTKDSMKEKMSGLKEELQSQIDDLKGQLQDAKADRNKYQTMLAPFQAAALKLYTNEPMQERLDMLAGELDGLSKGANIHLFLNDQTNLFECNPLTFGTITISNFITITNRKLFAQVFNDSSYSAVKCRIDFLATADPTNFDMPGWVQQPPSSTEPSHWTTVSDESVPSSFKWNFPVIMISTNFTSDYFKGQFVISADNAKTRIYYVGLPIHWEESKRVTNIIDKR